VLSRITDSRDVDRVIADALKHGVITRDADDPCGIDNVNALVREPIMAGKGAVATWFDPANKVYSERTITSAGSSLWDDGGIENLRPDRIVRRPDGQILVIDYKTGDQRRDKKYCGQVQRYIDKLRVIFPGTPIAGRVWYTTLGVIVNERGQALS
jgi:ATP-dependent exoDNAse (exonuclease V) beta subunit